MYQLAKPLFLLCESPLHAGSGSDLGIVDLPIQRERHTGFPKIESSSLKGALRERFEGVLKVDYSQKNGSRSANTKNMELVFGPESGTNDWETYASAIGFTDARLLLFPVKSMRGVFAWITCPRILNQFWQDMKTAEISIESEGKPIKEPKANTTCATPSLLIGGGKKMVLEAYSFSPNSDPDTQNLANWLASQLFEEAENYWQEKIKHDIVVLSNDDFTDFVNLSTEIITRTQIDNRTGTVKDGALFTEEYLPAESILYSLVLASPIFPQSEDLSKRKKLDNGKHDEAGVIDFFAKHLSDECKNRLQLGANATLGKGLIRTKLLYQPKVSQNGK